MDNKVSILIPVYNRERYLSSCIYSCLCQTYTNFQVIIYDDGSTDDSLRIIKSYKDSRFRVIHCPNNRGVGFARNELLKYVDTPYACWLDSDDMMSIDRVEKQLDFLMRSNQDIVYSYMQCIRDDTNSLGNRLTKIDVSRYSNDLSTLKNNTTLATGFFKKELCNILFLDIEWGGEDWIWLYVIIKKKYNIGLIPQFLYYNREYNKDRISSLKRKNKEDKEGESYKVRDFLSKIDEL